MHENGLKPLEPDARDRSLGAAFKLPPLSELPKKFSLGDPISIKDQGDSDMCTAYASCGASELQEGVELCPEYTFAVSKEKDPDSWGADLRDAMASHVKVGAIEGTEAPLDYQKLQNLDKARRLSNWPDLKDKASKHSKRSYFEVTGPYDHFDNIRAAMWLFRAEKRAVVFGVQFGWPKEQHFMSLPVSGTPHAMWTNGWDEESGEPFLEIVNSLGKDAGDNGRHWFSRDVINRWAGVYGVYMFVDMTKEEYEAKIRAKVLPLWKRVLELMLALLKGIDPETSVAESNAPIPVIVPPVPVAPTSRLEAWAKAIEKVENMKKFYPKHNNPGALRYSRFQTGVVSGYATFASYQDGWNALLFQLRIAADGRSKVYSPTDTLVQFFSKYAPAADRNNPAQYAQAVAKELGVPTWLPIKELL